MTFVREPARSATLSVSFVAVALLLAPTVSAQKNSKNKDQMAEAVVNARYVYVEAYDGPEWDPRLTADDRKAIADVERAVQSWGRYQLALRRGDAEIVLQVRKGRIAGARVGGGVSVERVPTHVEFPPSSTTQKTIHGDVGAEAGPPDDLLWVYLVNTKGDLGAAVWRRMQHDGLQAPELKLFEKFKQEVNASVTAQAKGKTSAPGAAPAAAPANAGGKPPETKPDPQPPPGRL